MHAEFFHVKINNQLVISEAGLGEDGKGIISSFDFVLFLQYLDICNKNVLLF